MTYSEIFEKLEAATGPDREIDWMVFEMAYPEAADTEYAPLYTASLDAVTALIESELPGWGKAVSDTPALGKCGGLFSPDNSKDCRSAGCASLPLALLTAAIRALADKDAING